MPLVDSHCHLQADQFNEDRDAVVARSLQALDWLVVIGENLDTSREAVALCRDHLYATVGVHPYDAGTVSEDGLAELRALAAHPQVVAIGEIGLDYFKYNDTPRDIQQRAFRDQLALAVELNLPVVIHNRESTHDLCAILDEFHADLPSGVLHCFAGDQAFVERVLSWDFYISFAGNVTFPKAHELREAAALVPLDRLLVETDSPYLAPQAVRGKRCEPAYVGHTAKFLGEFLGHEPGVIEAQTAENAGRLFRIG